MRLPFYYGWVIVAVVFVTMAVGVNARTAFSLLFPPILDEFGWDRSVTAGAFSFGFLVSALASPTLGRLMDTRGPRWVSALGVLTLGGGMVLASLASSPWQLYLTLGALAGLGSVCLGYTCQALFLPAWFVRRRGLAMSLAFAGVGIGSIVLLPALQVLIAGQGWRTACLGLGLLTLVVIAPLTRLLARRPEDLGLRPDAAGSDTHPSAAAPRSNIVDKAWASVDWTLGRALRTGRFWWLALGYFTALFAWYAVQVHQTRYLIEVGFGATEAAWALGLVSLAGVPGQVMLGQLSDRIGREQVWTLGNLGFIVTGLALLLLQARPDAWLLWTLVIAQGLLGYGVTSVFGAIPAEIFEGRHYGSIFGTLMMIGLAGGAAGPWVLGMVHDLTGSYRLAWVLCLLASLVAIAAIWRAAPGRIRAVAGRIGD